MSRVERQKIILVDDNMVTLTIGKNLLKDYYDVYALPSAAKLFEFLQRMTPDLILLDVEMPVTSGYEVIRELKNDRRYREIPVIFVTSKSDEPSELRGLALGAIDYVTKPFSGALLHKRIDNHLQNQKQKAQLKYLNDGLQQLVDEEVARNFKLQNAIINIVADLVEFRDNTTGGHIDRTQCFVGTIIEQLIEDDIYTQELSAWNMDYVLPSAPLHDLGKLAISDTILNKPGRFTPEEFEIMKTHVAKGVEAIDRMEHIGSIHEFLRHARAFVSAHHEKWDGSGYPCGLKALDIPLEGRIMAIADVYDALVSVRPYKKAFPTSEAARIIIDGAGTHFDPFLVAAFQKREVEFASLSESEANDRNGAVA